MVMPIKNTDKTAMLHREEQFKRYAEPKPVYEFFKRLFDVVVSLGGIAVLLPIFAIVAVAVKVGDEGPIIYKHKRVGKNGKDIYIYKFRSMVVDAEKLIDSFTTEQKEEFFKNFKLDNDPRITKIGKILRKTSLDELPQLFNVLLGDMSVIGPRPVTDVETELYGSYRELLLSVRPGLTGMWASGGRSEISYEKRRAMEIYYVKNRSFLLDVKIFFRTFVSVFRGLGAK